MKTFSDILDELDRGLTLEEIDDELRAVVGAVRASGKTGKLTLELSIEPASKGNASQFLVKTKIKSTQPKPDRGASFYYATDDNELVREDPKQMKLELREVPAEVRPIHEAGG